MRVYRVTTENVIVTLCTVIAVGAWFYIAVVFMEGWTRS